MRRSPHKAVSLIISRLVWAARLTPASLKLVALALADHAADDGGSVYPAVDRVAEWACMTPRQARRLITELIDAGVVHVVGARRGGVRVADGAARAGGAPGTTTELRFSLDRLTSLAKTAEATALPKRATEEARVRPTTGVTVLPHDKTEDIGDRDGGHGGAKRRKPMSSEPSGTAIDPAAADGLLTLGLALRPDLDEMQVAESLRKFRERHPRPQASNWPAWIRAERAAPSTREADAAAAREVEATQQMLRDRCRPLTPEEQAAADRARLAAMERLGRPVSTRASEGLA